MRRGKINIQPTEYMLNMFENYKERGGRLGLHAVHIFYPDAITGTLDCRKAYFDGYGDAELYCYEYDQAHRDKKESYLIYLDCEMYVGRIFGPMAEELFRLKSIEQKEISR